MLYGIEDRSLILSVRMVNQSSKIDQKLRCADMTLPHGIIDASLPIFVLFVDILMPFIDDKVDNLVVAVP